MPVPRAETPFDPLSTPPRVLLANFYPFAPGEFAPPRWSRSNLFLPCTAGRGIVQVGTRRFALSAGQVLHVPWATVLQYEADAREPFVLIGVHLAYAPWEDQAGPRPHHAYRNIPMRDEAFERSPARQPYAEPFVVSVPPDSNLLEYAAAVATAYERGLDERDAPDRDARLRAAALTFLLEFRACLRRTAAGAPHLQAGRVREIISFMELSYARTHTRAGLAERAGVSESTLAAAFRAVTGRSPIDYLIDVRLAHARRLLASSRLRVGEIARAVGMPDVYHFSKLFKKRLGRSPLAYRRRRAL
ncbi:MAG: helix-turn-helix transcriptional regulator [Planctomycetes bacterium]|nr:helix-turn-helix transcriptional regulator [Planctomycetota bacterium]